MGKDGLWGEVAICWWVWEGHDCLQLGVEGKGAVIFKFFKNFSKFE